MAACQLGDLHEEDGIGMRQGVITVIDSPDKIVPKHLSISATGNQSNAEVLGDTLRVHALIDGAVSLHRHVESEDILALPRADRGDQARINAAATECAHRHITDQAILYGRGEKFAELVRQSLLRERAEPLVFRA